MKRNATIREVAAERIAAGELVHKDTGRPITQAEVDALLGDVRKLTEGRVGGPGRRGLSYSLSSQYRRSGSQPAHSSCSVAWPML